MKSQVSLGGSIRKVQKYWGMYGWKSQMNTPSWQQWKIPIFSREYIFTRSILYCHVSLPDSSGWKLNIDFFFRSFNWSQFGGSAGISYWFGMKGKGIIYDLNNMSVMIVMIFVVSIFEKGLETNYKSGTPQNYWHRTWMKITLWKRTIIWTKPPFLGFPQPLVFFWGEVLSRHEHPFPSSAKWPADQDGQQRIVPK